MNGMEPNGVGPMSVDEQAKQSSDQEAWERVYFSRNGDIKQNNLSTPQLVVKKSPSLTPSDEDEECEEEGQDTPLPGSTADLDIVTWPMDDDSQHQVHVTVIPTDDERRRSRYSTYHQNHTQLIPRPDSHLCLAIVALFCCCFPFGVVGIICALQVDRAYDDGNREGAVWRSKNARYCSLTAVVFGMMGIVGASFYVIFYHLVPALS